MRKSKRWLSACLLTLILCLGVFCTPAMADNSTPQPTQTPQPEDGVEVTVSEDGTYTVSLAFCDEQDSPLLKMELMVPKEVMAKDIADRFRKNTEQLYASVINALFEAPREKKE